MSKGRAAATGGGEGAAVSVIGGVGLGAGGFVAGVLLAPVAGTAGAVYGVVAGMNRHEYEAVSNTVSRAVQDIVVTPRLAGTVAESVRTTRASPGAFWTNFVSGTVDSYPDYSLLSNQGAQTVLELASVKVGLTASSGINPPLTLQWVISARLVRISDGTELFATQFQYFGEAHKLRQWAANEGRLLRAALDQGRSALATQIAERIFLVCGVPDYAAQH